MLCDHFHYKWILHFHEKWLGYDKTFKQKSRRYITCVKDVYIDTSANEDNSFRNHIR